VISQGSSRTKAQETKFITEIGKFMKAKKSLFLWSDNTPYHVETDLVLKHFFNGMHMNGAYYGDKIITEGKINENSHFDKNHSIAYGLRNLHEGITICSPQNTHKDFKHFAYNSNNEPLVTYAEENEDHGRIILDCGFTKLFKS